MRKGGVPVLRMAQPFLKGGFAANKKGRVIKANYQIIIHPFFQHHLYFSSIRSTKADSYNRK
jgi:hypothetical protein